MKNYVLERVRGTSPGMAAVMPTIGMPDECSYVAMVPETSGLVSGVKLEVLMQRLDDAGFHNNVIAPPSAFGVCVLHVDHPEADFPGPDEKTALEFRTIIASIVKEVGLGR